eukprot:s669_g22.t1
MDSDEELALQAPDEEGAASFYKSMLDNALLRDPDRGLAHFKDTLRPYFVKGVNHVFLWRFLQLFRTYRGQNEFVHWIGRFEIAQKRLLAPWSDLLDLADLPDFAEVGTADFLPALTAAQQAEMANLPDDDARRMFPLSDNLMSLIFLVQADLNEQQRERFVSSMNIRQISMLQYTYLQVKTPFLTLFCVSRTGVADPNIAHRKRSSFYSTEEGETEDGEQGFWVVHEETGYGKKGGKRSRPGFRPRSKGKGYVATWDNDQQDTAFWQKGKGKKAKKGFMKGKDSFKGMPWKGGKGKGKDKGGKQSFPAQQQQANVAQQQPATASASPPQADKADLAEEGWGNYEYDWNDWTWYTSEYDVDYYGEDTSWYSWAYFASDMDLPETETSPPTVEGQTDQNDQICFHLCCLFRLIGHGLLSFMINMLMSVTLLYRLCIRL